MHYRLPLILLLFIITSCSTSKPTGKTEAEVLYKEAQELVKDERYLLATERLNALKSQYPYSYFSTHAELLQADILFLQESYVEAAAAYILFRDFHPKHKQLEYVIFKIAESYYQQLPSTFDRDLAPAADAIQYYEELIQRFPSSKYVDEAKNKIATAKGMQEKKELYIADFYFRTEAFGAAQFRYNSIIQSSKSVEDLKLAKYRVILSAKNAENYADCIKLSSQYKNDLGSNKKKELKSLIRECSRLYRQQITDKRKSGES